MPETKVDIPRLLEDLAQGYKSSLEEAIITEVMANALDSSASIIRFQIDRSLQTLTITDNGQGMTTNYGQGTKEEELEKYHNIAESGKVKGTGIGFAGLGAKLALLIAKEVITETKKGASHAATRWYLNKAQKSAPYEYIQPRGLVTSKSGTAVSIVLRDPYSDLLSDAFVENTIKTRFYPLLDREMMARVLRLKYKNGVAIYVNDKRLTAPAVSNSAASTLFYVYVRRGAKPVGAGFLRKSQEDLPEERRGLAIATLGMVIKQGWDWIGIYPRNASRLTGIVEVPAMAKLLNTQKEDFQKCAKYYEFRKAIEKAVLEMLSQMGEIPTSRDTPERIPKWLEKEIERVLGELLPDFPELQALLERRGKGEQVSGVIPDDQTPPVGTVVEGVEVMTGTKGGAGEGGGVPITRGDSSGERIEPSTDEPTESGYERSGRRRLPALEIQFADDPSREELGWLLGSVLFINQGHPAYQKISGNTQAEQCHQLFTVAWVLSHHIEPSKAPQEFINRFLLGWGKRT